MTLAEKALVAKAHAASLFREPDRNYDGNDGDERARDGGLLQFWPSTRCFFGLWFP